MLFMHDMLPPETKKQHTAKYEMEGITRVPAAQPAALELFLVEFAKEASAEASESTKQTSSHSDPKPRPDLWT